MGETNTIIINIIIVIVLCIVLFDLRQLASSPVLLPIRIPVVGSLCRLIDEKSYI